jgi:hypothetical protein
MCDIGSCFPLGEWGVKSGPLAIGTAGLAGASALGKRGRVASGAGCQPGRRRIFRIIIQSQPSTNPALLMPRP